MKVKELRIGNYVYLNWEDNVRIVTGLSYENGGLCNEIFLDDHNEVYEDDVYLNPIQLTDEWLEKLEFKKKSEECFFSEKINGGSILIRKIDGIFFYTPNMFRSIEIKYVHQLQNLYFALTGEELKHQDGA